MSGEAHNHNPLLEAGFLVSEIIVIVLFAFCTEYGTGVHPAAQSTKATNIGDAAVSEAIKQIQQKDRVQAYYPLFQDVHVMIYVGFGFLMVFLKKHCWTSVGYNFLIAAWSCQLAILITGFWHMALVEETFHRINLDIPSLIIGDFGAGAVLITFGVILGRCNLSQLWVLATLEIIFYGLNEAICAGTLQAVDMGGSMYVHTFGAYFGIAASFFFSPKKLKDQEIASNGEGAYLSQTIAMVGTLFLWMFWPSFNGALASEFQQQRVIINTVLAISSSCIAACALVRIQCGKLNMEVVLNSTLAGGVAVGSASDLVVTAGVAMAIGALAGILSCCGYLWLGAWLNKKIGLYDTCGVNNLHGMPGILGGVIGAISAGMAESAFQKDTESLVQTFPALKDGKRTTAEQGWIQLAALGITLGISLISGALCGFLASKCGGDNLTPYVDDDHWHEDLDYNLGEVTALQTTEMQKQLQIVEDAEKAQKKEEKRERKEAKRAKKAAKLAREENGGADVEEDDSNSDRD